MQKVEIQAPLKIQARFSSERIHTRQLLKLARHILLQTQRTGEALIKNVRHQGAIRLRSARRRCKANALLAAQREWQVLKMKESLAMQAQYLQTLERAKHEYLELCLAIAREVIGVEIRSNPESIRLRLENALKLIIEKEATAIKVHPDELACAERSLGQIAKRSGFIITPSPEIPLGNLRIETVSGAVDLDWREHLERLEEALKHFLQERPSCCN